MAQEGLTLDSGAFVAAERDSRRVWALLKEARNRGARLTTPATVLAQVWRSPPHPEIARLIRACNVESMGQAEAKVIGGLLGHSGTSDVVDAAVVVGAVARGDAILTSDSADIEHLLEAVPSKLTIVPI
jgi:hypothetical protein